MTRNYYNVIVPAGSGLSRKRCLLVYLYLSSHKSTTFPWNSDFYGERLAYVFKYFFLQLGTAKGITECDSVLPYDPTATPIPLPLPPHHWAPVWYWLRMIGIYWTRVCTWRIEGRADPFPRHTRLCALDEQDETPLKEVNCRSRATVLLSYPLNRYSRKVTSASKVITRRNAINLDRETRGSRALTWEIVLERIENVIFLKRTIARSNTVITRSIPHLCTLCNTDLPWTKLRNKILQPPNLTPYQKSNSYPYRTSLQWEQPIDLLLCTQLAPPAVMTPEDTRASDWKLIFILHLHDPFKQSCR